MRRRRVSFSEKREEAGRVPYRMAPRGYLLGGGHRHSRTLVEGKVNGEDEWGGSGPDVLRKL